MLGLVNERTLEFVTLHLAGMAPHQTGAMIRFKRHKSHSLLKQQPDKRLKYDTAKDGKGERSGDGGGGYIRGILGKWVR